MRILSPEARRTLNHLVHSSSPHAPDRAVAEMVVGALSGNELALNLHRLFPTGSPYRLLPGMNVDPAQLDAFLELYRVGRGPERGVRLTLTFDDGYTDAVAYVDDRAPRHPDVDFLVFVCPQKTRDGVGFRWDLFESRVEGRVAPGALISMLERDLDIADENRRLELLDVARHDPYRLADVDAVRALTRWPNVRLGNHTNNHFRLTSLPRELAFAELEQSLVDFETLFGPAEDLAFPFGQPGRDYGPEHVRWLRDRGLRPWSTESRPFRPQERVLAGALPRFPVGWQIHAKALAARIAWKAVRHRGDALPRAPEGSVRPRRVAGPDAGRVVSPAP